MKEREREGGGVCIYNKWEMFHYDNNKYIIPNIWNKKNIMNAQLKLPNKSIKLRNLRDYFKYIFIPSRKQSKVDEIRYINKSEVKAVQVLPNNSTVVYYNFIREDGKWKVNIPTL